MAESDEDYHSHRRDKFQQERGDYGPARERLPRRRDHQKDRVRDRSRERDRKEHRHHEKDHRHREKGHRHHDRGHDRGHHERGHSYHEKSERFSPPEHDLDFQPPTKHMRRDWDAPCLVEADFRAKQGERGVSHPHLHPWVPPERSSTQQSHGNFIPARFGGSLSPPPPGRPPCGLQSFKDFLLCLDPAVGEMEAVRRYTEYKLAFRRQQMEAFFVAHREEEWFRLRYHPEDVERSEAKTHDALQKRLGVYMYLSGMGWFDNVSLDIHQAPTILKVLDAVQILFEGGTENDLRALEEEEEEEEKRKERPPSRHQTLDEGQAVHSEALKVESKANSEQAAPEPVGPKGAIPDTFDLIRLARKKKHIDEGEVSECNSASISHPFGQSAEREAGGKRGKESMSDREVKEKKNQEDEEENKVASEPVRSCEERGKAKDGETEEAQKDDKKIREERELGRDKPPPLPRHLHKTRSLFMRNIPPSICKEEIVNLCVKYTGFRRVCLSEPLAEYRFFRRCWVTFDHLANIQDICWQLQNARVREYKLSPVVHRDLCRRVRTTNGITQHWMLLQDHIRLADKLIRSLDSRWTLWGEDQEKGNPLLKNISYHLIEEVNAEEEELSRNMGGAISQCEITVERDDKLVKVLDRLLLYLRLVHSVDFYNACHHASENDMPCCCGSFHVRGPAPPNRVLTQQMLEWQKKFEDKLSSLSPREPLGEEEAERMGRKHPAQEVEKFIRANAREIDRDKWLCVLCEKKFKGPEFVQKHLLTRHGEQVEEVRKEAVFFNNFLMDPKRPALPEMRSPPPMPTRPGQVGGGGGGGGGGGPEPLFSPPCVWGFGQPSPSPSPSPPFTGYQGSAVPPSAFGGDGGHWGWLGGGLQGKPQHNRVMHREPRKVIRYTDLDAPGEDFF